MDKDLISLFKHVVEGLRGKILPRDIGTVTRRLHLVLGNETLQNALYAKIPTWSSTVRHTLLNQPDSFEARLTASMLVEFSMEPMWEGARHIESSEGDKETLLWKTLDEMTDESRQPPFGSLFKSAPLA